MMKKVGQIIGTWLALCLLAMGGLLLTGVVIFMAKGIKHLIVNF